MRQQERSNQRDNRSQQSQGGEASAQAEHGRVSAAEVEKYIKGVDFPCDKDELIQCASENNAPEEVLDIMEDFPEQQFNSPVDVARCISEVKH